MEQESTKKKEEEVCYQHELVMQILTAVAAAEANREENGGHQSFLDFQGFFEFCQRRIVASYCRLRRHQESFVPAVDRIFGRSEFQATSCRCRIWRKGAIAVPSNLVIDL